MSLAPETLPRHELVGLGVEVTSASNPALVGTAGEVVTETTRTLGIEDADGVSQVPKADATFEFELPDGEVVTVAGDRLVGRPARRAEQTGDSKWR